MAVRHNGKRFAAALVKANGPDEVRAVKLIKKRSGPSSSLRRGLEVVVGLDRLGLLFRRGKAL